MKPLCAVAVGLLMSVTVTAQQQPIPPSVATPAITAIEAELKKLKDAMNAAPVDCVPGPWETKSTSLPVPSVCPITGVQTVQETQERTMKPAENGGSCLDPTTQRIVDKEIACTFVPPTTPTVPQGPPIGPVMGLAHGIPNLAANPTNITVSDGLWSNGANWSLKHPPTATEVFAIVHNLTVDTVGLTGKDGNIYKRLAFRPDVPTSLKVGSLTCYPGAELEIGTAINPAVKAELVIADRPIDLSIDPEQYGTGLIGLCNVTTSGQPKTTFLRLAAEPLVGSKTLTLSAVPSNWRAGDVLALPDTRQLTFTDMAPRPNGTFDNFRRKQSQSETVTIASISGTTVTLTTGLVFDHKGARDPEGVLVFLPHVANLSRTVTIRSENPAGTRGHVLFSQMNAIDIRYTAFEHLGRTTEAMIDDTTFDAAGAVTHIGTNAKGRYPLHFHHVPGICGAGAYQFTAIGNAITDGRKWSMTVHNSHYGLVQDTVVYDATGAGIVTEDGSETGNLFDHNLVMKVENGTAMVDPIETTGGADPFGRRGNGYWFRGIANRFTNNVAADTREGINYSPGSAESGPNSTLNDIRVPLYPCADTSMAGQYKTQQLLRTYNLDFTGNETYSTSHFGFGTWFEEMPTTGRVPFKKTTIWHFFGVAARYQRYWNGSEEDLTILNEGGQGLAVDQDNYHRTGMATSSTITRANIRGVQTIFSRGGQLGLSPEYRWVDGTFQSMQGFLLNAAGQASTPSNWTFTNLTFKPMPGQPLRAFTFTTGGTTDINNHPKSFTWDGQKLFYLSQAPGAPGPPPTISAYLGGGCAAGLTNQQCAAPVTAPAPQNYPWFHALATCALTKPEVSGGFVCP